MAIESPERHLLSISLVCKYWTDVLNLTHALWTTIRIITDGPDASAAFERSGKRPLDVWIVDSSPTKRSSPWYRKSVRLLRDNFYRVRALQIRSLNRKFIESILFPYATREIGAPMLGRLVVAAPDGRKAHIREHRALFPSSPLLTESLFRPSPCLKHLTLALPSDVHPSAWILATVTHLAIDRGADPTYIDMKDYIGILRAVAPRLQSLAYTGFDIFSYQRLTDELEHPIEMPQLRSLAMTVPSSGFEAVPLFAAPHLEDVRLTDHDDEYKEDWNDGDYTPVSDILMGLRDKCPLRRVELINLRYLQPETYRILFESRPRTPHGEDTLEVVVIHKGTLVDEILRNSTPSPTLKHLELREVQHITTPGLRAFVDSAVERRTEPLEVKVVNCDNIWGCDFEGFNVGGVTIDVSSVVH